MLFLPLCREKVVLSTPVKKHTKIIAVFPKFPLYGLRAIAQASFEGRQPGLRVRFARYQASRPLHFLISRLEEGGAALSERGSQSSCDLGWPEGSLLSVQVDAPYAVCRYSCRSASHRPCGVCLGTKGVCGRPGLNDTNATQSL